MRKRKVVEVEQPTEPVVQRKRPRVEIKEQAIPSPKFAEGAKVRLDRHQRDKEPYRIISRSVEYDWLGVMDYVHLYRVRKWDASVEQNGWADWHTSTVWESQIEPWIDESLDEEEPERDVLNVELETPGYIAGVTILNDAPDVYVTFTITEQGEQPWLTLRLQSK